MLHPSKIRLETLKVMRYLEVVARSFSLDSLLTLPEDFIRLQRRRKREGTKSPDCCSRGKMVDLHVGELDVSTCDQPTFPRLHSGVYDASVRDICQTTLAYHVKQTRKYCEPSSDFDRPATLGHFLKFSSQSITQALLCHTLFATSYRLSF